MGGGGGDQSSVGGFSTTGGGASSGENGGGGGSRSGPVSTAKIEMIHVLAGNMSNRNFRFAPNAETPSTMSLRSSCSPSLSSVTSARTSSSYWDG